MTNENLIEIKNLKITYDTKVGILGQTKKIHAVNNVSLEIKKGEILAIAGESGCGKSTLAKSIIKLLTPDNGEILLNGKNIFDLKNKQDFYKKVQIIFQNPYASLNPKMKIGQILSEALEINTKLTKPQIKDVILDKISKVGLDESILNLYPHEFSGGQRQRIAIARALVLEPEIIIADEPVSALDVSIQAQIINLLKELKENFNLTFLFISHDLSVIKYISDRIAIMYLGEIVEIGNTTEIFTSPKHPYTKALLGAVPELNAKNKNIETLIGELPSPENLPSGCKFHTRCPYALEICKKQSPTTTEISTTHKTKCFLYENFK